jgi:hypothetical protein
LKLLGLSVDSDLRRDVARLEEKLDSMAAVLTAFPALVPTAGEHGLSASSSENILTHDEEARAMLMTFRAELNPFFHFVVVPMYMTLPELRHTKPFLFSTMLMVSCLEDADRQLEMGHKIREYIGTSVVVKGESLSRLSRVCWSAWRGIIFSLSPDLSSAGTFI